MSHAERKQRTTIDWAEVHRRLAEAQAAVDDSFAPEPEQARRTLESRALALARETDAAAPVEAVEVVEFRLARERYAFESSCVAEVLQLDSLTPVPCTPAFVGGITNLRGEILSVIDLKQLLDLPRDHQPGAAWIIVLQSNAMRFGILADGVTGVRQLPTGELQTSLATLSGPQAQYMKGVTAERIVILDGARLLGETSLVVQEQVADPHQVVRANGNLQR